MGKDQKVGAPINRPDNVRGIQFPFKLHKILEEAERNGFDNAISWLPSGKAFKVHDRVSVFHVSIMELGHFRRR